MRITTTAEIRTTTQKVRGATRLTPTRDSSTVTSATVMTERRKLAGRKTRLTKEKDQKLFLAERVSIGRKTDLMSRNIDPGGRSSVRTTVETRMMMRTDHGVTQRILT